MPELPEVEITARRLTSAMDVAGVARRGKMLEVRFVGEGTPPDRRLSLLVHLMSAGRLQLFDERASMKDRRSRILIRLADGRELRLREFGTRQSAWAKVLDTWDVGGEEMVATLGPDAWPAPDYANFATPI